jgi:hypothetical protein
MRTAHVAHQVIGADGSLFAQKAARVGDLIITGGNQHYLADFGDFNRVAAGCTLRLAAGVADFFRVAVKKTTDWDAMAVKVAAEGRPDFAGTDEADLHFTCLHVQGCPISNLLNQGKNQVFYFQQADFQVRLPLRRIGFFFFSVPSDAIVTYRKIRHYKV